MKTFFGGMFMNKENLRKEGILYPIKLEYYKIKDLKSKNDNIFCNRGTKNSIYK